MWEVVDGSVRNMRRDSKPSYNDRVHPSAFKSEYKYLEIRLLKGTHMNKEINGVREAAFKSRIPWIVDTSLTLS